MARKYFFLNYFAYVFTGVKKRDISAPFFWESIDFYIVGMI